MLTKSEIVEEILVDALVSGERLLRDRVDKLLRRKYIDICRMHPWMALRREEDYDFTADTGTGLWLPSNILGMMTVWDAENEMEFRGQDSDDRRLEDHPYTYDMYVPDATPLFRSNDDCDVSYGGTTFTCTSLAAANHTGYWCQFGVEPGYYKLTAATTFTPTYYGPDLSDDNVVIRPVGTQKMRIYDPDKELLADRTLELYYWEAPQPLYREDDRTILPYDEPLILMVLKALPEAKARRPVSQGEIDEHFKTARGMDPVFMVNRQPRDKRDNPFEFTNFDMYEERE